MKTFFATFGTGKPFRGKYVGIVAENESDAREAMFECFGEKWGFMYRAKEGKELERQVTDYGLSSLLFLKVGPCREGETYSDCVKLIGRTNFAEAYNLEQEERDNDIRQRT